MPEDTQLEVVELRLDPKCVCVQSHRAHPQSMFAELRNKSHWGRSGGRSENFLKEMVFEFAHPGCVFSGVDRLDTVLQAREEK